MSFRIDASERGRESVLSFLGSLDRASLEELRRRIEERIKGGKQVRVILRSGTDVEPGTVDELVKTAGIELQAESNFLAYWIEKARKQSEEE